MEKITYLVTNYNNAKYIGECLDSIIAQNNPNWDCLVIDDCSSDNSVSIIKQYESEKIKLIRNEKNINQIKSLIKLFGLCKTDIVGIIDSDDTIHQETTDFVLDGYKISPKIGLVYTNCIEYDENLKEPIYIGHSERLPFGPVSSIVFGYVSSLRTFRLSAYYKTQGYDLDLLYAEDLDLMYKLEEVCLPYFINKYLYNYRRVPKSRSREVRNRTIGLENHYLAKKNAIKRRLSMSRIAITLSTIYVHSEYRSKLNKLKSKKINKKFWEIIQRVSKELLSHYAYKSKRY